MCQSENNQSTLHYHRPVVFLYCALGCYVVPFPHILLWFTMSCREDVVSLSNGVFANVLHLWEEVCWPNHTTSVGIKEGAFQRTL